MCQRHYQSNFLLGSCIPGCSKVQVFTLQLCGTAQLPSTSKLCSKGRLRPSFAPFTQPLRMNPNVSTNLNLLYATPIDSPKAILSILTLRFRPNYRSPIQRTHPPLCSSEATKSGRIWLRNFLQEPEDIGEAGSDFAEPKTWYGGEHLLGKREVGHGERLEEMWARRLEDWSSLMSLWKLAVLLSKQLAAKAQHLGRQEGD